ncbi:MAG: malectin domain-containing carbohydrate-binding protein [Nocardioidaceae bacterium]
MSTSPQMAATSRSLARGGPFPGSLCDTVTRWETNAIGTNIQPTWIDDAGGDTLYSVAITDDAIYVGGHQRWLNNASGRDFAGGGAVPRPGLGAVDPLSGVPLEWNPGRNPRGIAIYDMFVGQTGLWIGSNTDFIGNRKYKRPKLAFFPTAGGEVAPAGVSPSLPGNLYLGSPLPGTNSNILYRVNAGGPMIGATDNGPDWAGDRGDTNSPYRNGGSNDADWGDLPFNRGANLPATTPTAVFSTERWSPSDNPPMEWDFPAPTGDDVTVRLYFANGCSCTETPGARRFNVALDGTRVLDAYDIVADVGDQTGTMKEFTVTSDGNVDIDFSHQDENPLVNAIEIIDTDIAPPPPGSDPGLRYRSVNGTTIGSEVDAADGGTRLVGCTGRDEDRRPALLRKDRWHALPPNLHNGRAGARAGRQPLHR